tara:strand:- start:334 stop:747 length:414 start_codon:yes stop_codon:yes gene_type:complete
MSNKEWFFYIIYNNNFTYAGVSPDPKRRLKQHNGEISGGAKYTTSKGTGWKHLCIISGFQNKIQSMQFEWAVKHVPPINSGGIKNRINKLFFVLNKDKWTSKAPLASNIPLNILWMNNEKTNHHLPDYITQKFNCSI